MKINNVEKGNCILLSDQIDDNSIDLIFCDLPYGETNNKWDEIIPFDDLWKVINRVKKKNAAVCLFAKGKFLGKLMCSNIDNYHYKIAIQKTNPKGHLNAKKMPLKAHEDILVFYEKMPTYNPQKTFGHNPINNYTHHNGSSSNYGKTKEGYSGGGSTDRYPLDVLKFSWPTYPIHPTEKPIELCEYIIKTFSNEGDTILDLTTGYGSIPLAAIKNNRNFYAFDNGVCDKEQYNGLDWAYMANKRIYNYINNKDYSIESKIIINNIYNDLKNNNICNIYNISNHHIEVYKKDNEYFIALLAFDEDIIFDKNKLVDFSKKEISKCIKNLLKRNKKLLMFDKK